MTMPGSRLLDESMLQKRARAAAADYANAQPFPHAVFRDLIDPGVLRGIARDAQQLVDDGEVEFKEHAFGRKGAAGHNRTWSGDTRELFHELNSAVVIRFLETLTGIEGLIPDPHYIGGGLHVIPPKGFLGVHADFSQHERLRLDRRLNVILYLNDDWDRAWGGDLELWDSDMGAAVKTIGPELGTLVVFSTLSDGFHGHPQPLSCPEDRSRLSMATYYYTTPSGSSLDRPDHPTLWQARYRSERRLADWVPPAVARRLRRFRR